MRLSKFLADKHSSRRLRQQFGAVARTNAPPRLHNNTGTTALGRTCGLRSRSGRHCRSASRARGLSLQKGQAGLEREYAGASLARGGRMYAQRGCQPYAHSSRHPISSAESPFPPQQQRHESYPPSSCCPPEPQVAADDVLEQAHRRLLRQPRHHAAQHRAHRKEALRGGADVGQAHLRQRQRQAGGCALRRADTRASVWCTNVYIVAVSVPASNRQCHHPPSQWRAACLPLPPSLTLSSSIFCTMKVATVLDSSLPVSMVRRHSGMISVDSRKLITSVSSTWGQEGWAGGGGRRPYCEGRAQARQTLHSPDAA